MVSKYVWNLGWWGVCRLYIDMAQLFSEKQYLRVWWLRILVSLLTVGTWVAFVVQIFYHTPVGTDPAPDWGMYPLLLVMGIAFPWFFFTVHLRVTVTEDRLRLRYFPFVTKTWTHDDIAQATAVTFRPIREHGGWGIKYSIDGAWVYSAYGNTGVELLLRDGKKVIIGSQRSSELAQAILRLR